MSKLTRVASWLVKLTQPFTGAVERQLSEKLSEMVSVKDFGAKGDGVTDDAPALRNALAAASGSGNILYFPRGTYRLLQYVEFPSDIVLEGGQGSKIHLDVNMTLGTSFGGAARAMYGVNKFNIVMRNMKFYSTKTGVVAPITIAFLSCVGLTLENCQFDDFGDSSHYAQGIVAFQTTGIRITNSYFRHCSGDGAALSNSCLDFQITGCNFEYNGDWGLALVEGSNNGTVGNNKFIGNVSTATGTDRCSHVHFICNTMINNEHGVRISEFAVSTDKNQYITILGNTIVNSGNSGISVENMNSPLGNFTVSGNTVQGSGGQGIKVVNTLLGCITGNNVYSSGNAAILFNNDLAGRETGIITVTGNTLNGANYGIQELVSAGNIRSNVIGPNSITGMEVANTDLLGASVSIDMNSDNYISLSKTVNLPSGSATTTASSGGVQLPVNAQGFYTFYVGGLLRKFPFYNA